MISPSKIESFLSFFLKKKFFFFCKKIKKLVNYIHKKIKKLILKLVPSSTMASKIDTIAMLSLRHHNYQSNFDFNKN